MVKKIEFYEYYCDACEKQIKAEDVSGIDLPIYSQHRFETIETFELCTECFEKIYKAIVKPFKDKKKIDYDEM